MNRAALIAIGFAGAMVVATGAWSADPAPVQVAPVVVEPSAPDVAAVVEVFGGGWFHRFDAFEGDENCSSCHATGIGFGGTGRAAWMVTPTLSLQLDVWAEHWSGEWRFDGESDGSWFNNRMGVGTHLTSNTGNLQFGGLVSLGARTTDHEFGPDPLPGTFANLAVEAAFNASSFRVYGQAGYVFAVAPAGLRDHFANDLEARNFYGRLVGTFYPQPNIALSANVGLEVLTLSGGPWGRGIIWGGRAEFQPNGAPIYFFGSYQGAYNAFEDSFTAMEHAIRFGLGINVGSPDLQSRDMAVGLKDYNCVFGVAAAGPCLIDYHGGPLPALPAPP